MESLSVDEEAKSLECTNVGLATLEALPDDAILLVLKWLQPQDLATLCLVSKRLQLLANNDSLWKRFGLQFWYKKTSRSGAAGKIGSQRSWKEAYIFGRKWTKGSFKWLPTINLFPKNLMPWLQINNQGNILMVSQGSEIVSYSTPKMLQHQGLEKSALSKLKGHTNDVTRFVKNGNYIYSASLDKTVRVWAVGKKSRCIAKLTGHINGIYCIQANRDIVVSGSRDQSIKIWSNSSFTCLETIDLEDQVRSLCLNQQKSQLIAGMSAHNVSYGALRIYDLNRGKLIYDLKSSGSTRECLGAGIVQLILEDPNTVLSCGYDTSIRLWDLRARQCVRTWMDPHDNAVFCMETNKNWMILSGTNRHGVVRLWDKRMSSPLRSLFTAPRRSGSPVYSMKYTADGLYVTMSSSIRILHFVNSK